MRRTLVIRFTLLVLASISVWAQDNSSKAITIDGGSATVYLGAQMGGRSVHGAGCVGFYDNVCGGGYNNGTSYTVSDGSPINAEWSPANQFKSGKTGVTKKITVALGCVTGNCTAILDLMKDCSNTPCGNPDGKPHICQGTLLAPGNGGLVSIECKAKLTKGKYYWVLIQSKKNAWLGWYWSLSANGGLDEGLNDTWQGYTSGQSTGALTVQ